MSWRSKALLLCLPFLLAACGFEPLYGKPPITENAPDSRLNAGVKIDSIPGHLGQVFKNHLEDVLNPGGSLPKAPAYRLVANIGYITVPVSVARNGTVSRYNLNFSSDYVIIRTADEKPVTSGSVSYLSSYNNLTNIYFATYQAQQDALNRGTQALADLYRQRITAWLDSGAPVSDHIVMPGKKTPIPEDSLLRQQQGTTINFNQQ